MAEIQHKMVVWRTDDLLDDQEYSQAYVDAYLEQFIKNVEGVIARTHLDVQRTHPELKGATNG